MQQFIRWGARLLGPVLLIVFLVNSDIAAIGSSIQRLSIWTLVLALGLLPVFVVLKSWRWNALMRELNLVPPRLGVTMLIYTAGLFLGGTTPGQSGDLVKAWYVQRRGQPLAPLLLSIVLDRLFDVVLMALIALLTVGVFFQLLPDTLQVAMLLLSLVAVALLLLLMARQPRTWIINRILAFVPHRLQGMIAGWRDQVTTLSLRWQLMGPLLFVSLVAALTTMLRSYLFFVALGLDAVPLLAIIAATALISLLQILPISIAGIGVRDWLLIMVLGAYGYPMEQALILSALFLLVNISQILVGFLAWLLYPPGMVPQAAAREPDTLPRT